MNAPFKWREEDEDDCSFFFHDSSLKEVLKNAALFPVYKKLLKCKLWGDCYMACLAFAIRGIK